MSVNLAVIVERRIVQHLVELECQFADFLRREHAREDIETGATIGVENVLREAPVFVETHGTAVTEPGSALASVPAVGLPGGLVVSGHAFRLS